jgi:hypothetical protein
MWKNIFWGDGKQILKIASFSPSADGENEAICI